MLDSYLTIHLVAMALDAGEDEELPYSFKQVTGRLLQGPGYRLGRVPDWFINLLEFLEDHSGECNLRYSDVAPGGMYWVKYHEFPQGSIPSNFVAIGDAVMKIPPTAGKCNPLAVH